MSEDAEDSERTVLCTPCNIGTAVTPTVPAISYSAHELATAYEFPPYTPSSKVVIGVLSFGGGLHGVVDFKTGVLTDGDVQAYWLTACGVLVADLPTVIIKPFLTATNNTADAAGTMENTLDVTILGACRPGSGTTIVLYLFPNGIGMTKAFQLAFTTPVTVSPGVVVQPNIFSVSWGHNETGITQKEAWACDAHLAQAAAAGINVCAASGDSGSNDGMCIWPAASPHVIACGGTSLYCPSATRRYADADTLEYGWSGSGGGTSAYFSVPPYQVGTVPPVLRRRCVPDVALNADPKTGVIVVVNATEHVVGGTSAAAPLFAAYLARTNPCSFLNPVLYSVPRPAFHDVLLGSNGLFAAAAGFDCCTGMGSINGGVLDAACQTSGPIVHALAIREGLVKLCVGSSYPLTTTAGHAAAAGGTTWTSSNPGVLSVTAAGVVAGVSVGTATVTVAVDGRPTASRTVGVYKPVIPVTGISIPNPTVTLPLPQTTAARVSLTAVVVPTNATNRAVSWSSSNAGVVTVSATGLLTPRSVGIAVVTATSSNNLRAVATVTVSKPFIPVTAVALSKPGLTLVPLASFLLSAVVSPANATNTMVTWTSSNPAIVSVSTSGLLTARSAGTATVVATSASSSTISALTTVTVQQQQPPKPAAPPGVPVSALVWHFRKRH